MAWIHPLRIARNVKLGWEVVEGGGPKSLRVRGVDPPSGLILPSSDLHLEVEAADGRVVEMDVTLPLPPLHAWSWRIGRKLGVPLVADFDPTRIRFDLPLPRG